MVLSRCSTVVVLVYTLALRLSPSAAGIHESRSKFVETLRASQTRIHGKSVIKRSSKLPTGTQSAPLQRQNLPHISSTTT